MWGRNTRTNHGWSNYSLTHSDNSLCIFHTVIKVHPNFGAKFPCCELHTFTLDSFGDPKTLLLGFVFLIQDTASTIG